MWEAILSFFQSVGEVRELYTMVDYYAYIKGLEYLICVGFFVGFPILYRYINKTDDHPKSETEQTA